MIKTTNASISGWPDFDFRSLPLDPLSRKQLAGIYDHVRCRGSVPPHRSKLLTGVIIPAIFVPERGLYLPASDNIYLLRKLRVYCERFDVSFATFPRGPVGVAFFSNALLIPPGYGTASFSHHDAAMPALRMTNAGFLAVTLEIDCKTRDDLEQNLAWTRGRSGDFGKSAFAQVDAKLCRFEDYRGYTIVFSGNRSLHFHFLFSTAHLEHCPAGAAAVARFGENQPRQSALMCNAHTVYWDRVAEIFYETLGPCLQADRKLRSVTQWRRTPWALRRLEKDSDILNLPMGTIVPQLVLHENIRTRASGGARDFLVPRTFSLADPIKSAPRASGGRRPHDFEVTPMIRELQDMCAAEWGPYPRPVSMALQGGEWLFKFKNHEHDANPSTLVLGGYRRLQLNGRHTFTQAFHLPEGMTAQDLGDLLALRFGAGPSPSAAAGESPSKENMRSGGPLHLQCSRAWARSFREPISENANGLRKRYRDKFGQILVQATAFDRQPMLLTSGEGIGKSTALLRILAASAFDRALARRQASATRKFVAFAFRSRKQAEEKAEDFRQHGVSTMAVKTFWDHLGEACRDAGIPQLGRDDFDEHTASNVLNELASQQPAVFDLMEARRSQLWSRARFDDATTVLVMTHKAAEHWQMGRITRAWHHPHFDPSGDPRSHEALASQFALAEVVFDDAEALDFVHLLPEALYVFVRNTQAQYHGWRNIGRAWRRDVFDALKADIPGTLINSFEDFDELMRLDLQRLRPYAVDYETIPFGRDNPNASGIYRPRDGDRYFLGVKRWLFEMQARPIFLTTETLVANAIEKAIGEVFAEVIKRPSPGERNDEDIIETESRRGLRNWSRRPLFRLVLDNVPGVYPIHVPLFLDARARADRKDGGQGVSALAAEIAAADPNAAIISDGVSGVPNAYTFQSMKGLNGLERKNLYIILTWLAPDKYVELNVLGQWLGCGRVIEQHYQDQINQAAGRNRGFRQTEAPAKTVVFASKALWSGYLRCLEVGAPRTRLFLTKDQSWKGQDLAAEAEPAS